MKKIPSFTIDHIHMLRGIYVSRKDNIGNETVTTFDIRMKEPNREPAIGQGALHTIEHLAATFLRNHPVWGDKIVYWGPMGCLTGNYLLMKGDLASFAERRGLDDALFRTVLKKLGLERVQFEKRIEDYSEGQKKKVLLASSLCEPAHLFLWDEPLNFIDIFSRIQLEELLLSACPTMLFVEHDRAFREKTATRIVEI